MANKLFVQLLVIGILSMVACNKRGIISPAAPQLFSTNLATAGANLSERSPGTLQVITIAGRGTPGYVEGTTTVAAFNNPASVAIDASGNVYIADMSNHVIRKMTTAGVVSTLAGNGIPGFINAQGSAAQFNNPTGVAVDAAGNVYVADKGNHLIRKITAAGAVTTLAGTPGSPGSTDGPGTTAQFNFPSGIAIETSGNILVADAGNNKIRRITPAGFVSLVAGTGSVGGGDGFGAFAQFNAPSGITADVSGNIYVADAGNNKIRQISGGIVSTFAGGGASGSTPGFVDATGTAALFANPIGITIDVAGNLLVTDKGNHAIRQVTSAGVVITLTGNGTAGFVDGLPAVARFNSPTGIAVDGAGNLFIADQNNHRIREMGIIALVSTVAGDGVQGFAEGQGLAAEFSHPADVALDAAGNMYVADFGNKRIRKITAAGVVSTYAGNNLSGYVDGPVATAQFYMPEGIAVDDSGIVYVVDGTNVIRRITPSGFVSTWVGNHSGGNSGTWGFVDGPASVAQFERPVALAVDASGNVYVADNYNAAIRKITRAGVVSTLAGSGVPGYADGTGRAAQFNTPSGVAVDDFGNVYVADAGNNRIRKITPAGTVTTLAGAATGFWGGYLDGPGNIAQFNGPTGIVADGAGNLYVSENGNSRIRKVTPSGDVSTFAGSGPVFFTGAGFLDGPALIAKFSSPAGLARDASGTIYVADVWNNRIRKIQ